MKITPEAVKERIAALESAGELSLKEQFYLEALRQLVAAMDSEPVALHMGEAINVFNALKVEQLSERVNNAGLGPMGASNVQVWTSKAGGRLEFISANGGCTLNIFPQPVPVVPEGYKLVPTELTSEMVKAFRSFCEAYDDDLIAGYKAILEASPQPVPVAPDELKETVADFLTVLDEYPERLVPINRDSAVVRALRAAMLPENPVCTCPSGDGSLRWPCPVHPGKSPVIPDGYVLVPIEPTEAMCDISHIGVDVYCGITDDNEYYSIGGAEAAKVWKAMLAAAPQEVKGE